MAHRYVSAYAESLGLSPGFSLLDPADVADVMDLMREEFGLSGSESRTPRSRTLVEAYSRCINTQRALGEVLAVDFPWCEPHLDAIAALFRAFTERRDNRPSSTSTTCSCSGEDSCFTTNCVRFSLPDSIMCSSMSIKT